MSRRVPRVLSVAGTDPTGGAGIQADLKSVGALGGYGMAVVTALVAQNTRGVRSVHVPPREFLAEQLRAVSDDVGIDAVKLGMLHSRPLIDTVAAWLAEVRPPVVVLDPVMVATSGDRLLDADAEDAIRRLCRRVDLVTPNIPELAVLVDAAPAADWEEARAQAARLAADTGATVLLKGGHLAGEDCPDAIVTEGGVRELHGRRIASSNTHGTGCSLSSAVATLRAQGRSWPEALERAKAWLAGAIAAGAALGVGEGNGPVDHFHEQRPTSWAESAWELTAEVRREAEEGAFVCGLRDGTLDAAAFRWYLGQDVVYLSGYARSLARASALAPDAEEQAFWARSAAACLEEEATLHRAHLGDHRPDPEPATIAYLDHLAATSANGAYAELTAALLPCFWLYSELGSRLAVGVAADHPYGDWLATYGDPGFADATRTAVEIADRAAAAASAAERERMTRAFVRSMAHEAAFFAAPPLPDR